MKRNKEKSNLLSRLWSSYRLFSKKLFIVLFFLILFFITLFLVYKHYKSMELIKPDISIFNLPKQPSSLLQQPEPQSRLIVSEEKILLQQRIDKLIALDVLRGAIEGFIPLETLKTFLEKKEEPWAKDLLITLSPVKKSLTYRQLESLLVLPPPPSASLWKRIKNKIKSFIQIRKIGDEHKTGQLKDIKKALQAHDIREALNLYETLPPQEKSQLASWHSLAKDRLLLEESYRDFLKLITKS